MGNLLTEAMGNVLTALVGNVLTELVGKVLDIYSSRDRLWLLSCLSSCRSESDWEYHYLVSAQYRRNDLRKSTLRLISEERFCPGAID